jgi:hypothetical protein
MLVTNTLQNSKTKASKSSENGSSDIHDCRGCTCGVGSGIRTHATLWVTGFQGLRVIRSAIPTTKLIHELRQCISFIAKLFLQSINCQSKKKYATKKGWKKVCWL